MALTLSAYAVSIMASSEAWISHTPAIVFAADAEQAYMMAMEQALAKWDGVRWTGHSVIVQELPESVVERIARGGEQ